MGVVFGDCLVMVECWMGNLVASTASDDDVAGIDDRMKYLSMRNRHASYRRTHIITTSRTLPVPASRLHTIERGFAISSTSRWYTFQPRLTTSHVP